MAYVEFPEGVIWLPEYMCVLKRMSRRQVQRVREWDSIRFQRWEDVVNVIFTLVDVVEQSIGDGPGDEWMHLWREQLVLDTTGTEHVCCAEWGSETTENRSLFLRDDSSLWVIVHEMAHIADIPRCEAERFNGREKHHGRSFLSFVNAIADAFESRLSELEPVMVRSKPKYVQRSGLRRSVVLWDELPDL